MYTKEKIDDAILVVEQSIDNIKTDLAKYSDNYTEAVLYDREVLARACEALIKAIRGDK